MFAKCAFACALAYDLLSKEGKLRLIVGLVFGIAASIMVGCGDGAEKVEPVRTVPPRSTPTVQTTKPGGFEYPCDTNQFVQGTPRLQYQVKFQNETNGMVSFDGVLVMACMGQTDPGRKAAMETLAKGLQTWLMTSYPKGATETTQVEFESKVCVEVARLMSADRELAKITWVSLATNGTFILGVNPAGTNAPVPKNIPTPNARGNYSDPGCKLPKQGPTA